MEIDTTGKGVGDMPKRWSEQDLMYLEERWGSMSIKGIAAHLGRSVTSVKLKAYRIGLGAPSLSYDGITLNQLSLAINVSYSTLASWAERYDLPIKRKVFAEKEAVWVINYSDFWKWAEANKQMIDFTKIEPLILGPEPKWVEEKRNADLLKQRKIKKGTNQAWTPEEDNILKGMLNAYCYTYPEISDRLKRSEAAVKRRIRDLGLKSRPVRLNNHIKYTKDEVKTIETLLAKGYCLEDIATRINKSAIGIRGKLERMGYKFRNGVPYKKQIS